MSSKKLKEKISLDKVIGLTSLSNSAFATTPSGNIVYAAGCVAVVYNPESNKQIGYFRSTKAISSLCVSPNGMYLAIGERGNDPLVSVWSFDTFSKISNLSGHQYGIGCLSFSPTSKYLVSVGFKYDKQVILWDWATERRISSQKLENKVNAISFHYDSAFFVTCGDHHLKWWYITKGKDGNPEDIIGKPASILESQRDYNFVDIKCGDGDNKSSVYCVTSQGVLCLLHESRLMDKWVQLESSTSYSLCLSPTLLFVGCARSVTRAFHLSTLEYVETLPVIPSKKLPACYAVQHIPMTSYVVVLYADRSFYVWDVVGNDVKNAVKLRSFIFHQSCIWDIQFIENHHVAGASAGAGVAYSNAAFSSESVPYTPLMPSSTFVTCGADNKLLFWNLDPAQQRKSPWKSGHSRELLHCADLDEFEIDEHLDSTRADDRLCEGLPDSEMPDRQQGPRAARCLAVHPVGHEVACGTKAGRICVIDLKTMRGARGVDTGGICAHDAEILSLSYSPMISRESLLNNGDIDLSYPRVATPLVMLASGGRDRLVHVFDASLSPSQDAPRYGIISTLDSHSSSVTVVKFTPDGDRLVSCGGDKLMVINSVVGSTISKIKSIQSSHGTINGLAIDIATNKYAVSSGQDKRINVWNLHNGKLMRSYRPVGVDCELFKTCMDPSGMFIATSSFDKIIRIFDFFSGDLVAQSSGHSDLITGLEFSPNGRALISVGGDGCIMVWKLSEDLVTAMQDRLVELCLKAEKKQKDMQEKAALIAAQEREMQMQHSKPSMSVRTGGMSGYKKSENVYLNIPSPQEASTPLDTRESSGNNNHFGPATAVYNSSKPSLPSTKAPAWAKVSEENANLDGNGKESQVRVSSNNNKWLSKRSNDVKPEDSNLGVFGRAFSENREKHKLTLEVTSSTLMNKLADVDSQSADIAENGLLSRRANTLENSDEVMMSEKMDEILHTPSEEDVTADEDLMDDEMLRDFKDDEDVEVDILNKTSDDLDALVASAAKLEGWLERKILEEAKIDESFSKTLNAAVSDGSVNGDRGDDAAQLGSSMSADFFRNMIAGKANNARQLDSAAYRGDNLLPLPPAYSDIVNPNEDVLQANESRLSFSDAIHVKSQETASAIAQMRERLRSMGILDRTNPAEKKNPPMSQSPDQSHLVSNDDEVGAFMPPPPPAYHAIANLPKGNPRDDDEMSDVASTVSGSEDEMSDNRTVNHLSNPADTAYDDGGVPHERESAADVDSTDLLEFEEILSELRNISAKALAAYSKLSEKRKSVVVCNNDSSSLISSHAYDALTPSADADTDDSSSRLLPKPSFESQSLSSRDHQFTRNIDSLLSRYQQSFQSINASTYQMLQGGGATNNSQMLSSDSQQMSSNTYSISTLDNNANNSSSSTTLSNAPDVTQLLEKYADQLAKMVTDKISSQHK